MELVYLWVEEYKNIHEQGFNFSPQFSCSYDKEKKELTINKNSDGIENFFGNKTNVTAIVGKNGSGKSAILELLFSNNIELSDIKGDYYFIVVIGSKLILYYFLRQQLIASKELELSTKKEYIFSFVDIKDSPCKKIENLSSIFYTSSNIIQSVTRKNNIENSYNLSLFETETYRVKKLKSIENSINMIKNNIKFNKLFQPPSNIYITFKNNQEDKVLSVIYTEQVVQIKENCEEDFLNKVLEEIAYIIYVNSHNEIRVIEDSIINNNPNTFLDLLKILCDAQSYPNFSTFKNFINEVEKINREYNLVMCIGLDGINSGFMNSYFELMTNPVTNLLYSFDLLDFKWSPNLSTGQETYLFQFADFNNVLISDKNNNIMLLIDEGETTLHPDWQKRYIKYLTDFLSDNFPNKNIHIILSSHSPFVLSDLSKENVIFLDAYKEQDIKVKNGSQKTGNCKVVDGLKKKKQTFGANIHTLLSDGFFMENGLMGEFAKGKIDKIIKFLREGKVPIPMEKWVESKVILKQTIKCIGEPFLQNKVMELYYDKYIDEATKDERRRELEQQKEQIERELSKYD